MEILFSWIWAFNKGVIMMEYNRSVLWGSPKHWRTTAPVGSHGYASQFTNQGWQVLFISSPITPLHRLFAADSRLYGERIAIHKDGGRWEENGMLWEYVPWSLVPSKKVPNWWLQLSFGNLEKALKKASIDMKPSIVWIDNPEFGELFAKYPFAKHVLRIADRNQDLKGFNHRLLKQQRKLAQEADLVVVTSYSLEREWREMGINNLLRVPNGVDLRKFQGATSQKEPPDLKGISRPIAIFIGMIDHWFDVNLLKSVAGLLPDISFVIIGRRGINVDQLRSAKNIHILGERSPQLVPTYLQYADVGIIPFEQSKFSDAINPVKYYEYTASGLPVVATDTLEFRQLGDPVLLATNAEQFAAQIVVALQGGALQKEALKKQASGMSWESRWKVIMNNLFPGSYL
ncbi:MAG: glycosyltransferase [Firmicutes bacterium]|nr:glycosyltransferase [Bacillota bacterium]